MYERSTPTLVPGMSNKRLGVIAVLTVMVLGITIGLFNGMVDRNDDQNWQVVQSVGGDLDVKSNPGWYLANFAKVFTWPKASDTESFSDIRVTFNDGGNATLNGNFRYRLPMTNDQRLTFNREFGTGDGASSMENVHAAVESHLKNCFKTAGPMMSGSEHQSARKGEFYQTVLGQFENGLYQTERVEVQLKDQTDENGEAITVWATKIILGEDGTPLIKEKSPLAQYGLEITQFSIGDTEYDDATLRQFAAKKEAYLQIENNKAQRQQMVEERLMIEERGRKDKAEVEAIALKDKAQAVIEAQKRVELAEASARQAEEQKKQALVEAARDKESGVIAAEKLRDIAALNLEAEKLNAEAVKIAAAAEEERIAKAGAITEEKRILAEIERETKIGVAKALATVKVPSTYVAGGAGASGAGGDAGGNLMNLILLRAAGIIDNPKTGK